MSWLPVRDPAQRELVVVMSLKTGRKTNPLWVTCAADLINVNQPVILIGNASLRFDRQVSAPNSSSFLYLFAA